MKRIAPLAAVLLVTASTASAGELEDYMEGLGIATALTPVCWKAGFPTTLSTKLDQMARTVDQLGPRSKEAFLEGRLTAESTWKAATPEQRRTLCAMVKATTDKLIRSGR